MSSPRPALGAPTTGPVSMAGATLDVGLRAERGGRTRCGASESLPHAIRVGTRSAVLATEVSDEV